MPREQVTNIKTKPTDNPNVFDELPDQRILHIGWNDIGWVQLYVGEPHKENGWLGIVDLDREEINKLIRTLRKARDRAYGRDE